MNREEIEKLCLKNKLFEISISDNRSIAKEFGRGNNTLEQFNSFLASRGYNEIKSIES